MISVSKHIYFTLVSNLNKTLSLTLTLTVTVTMKPKNSQGALKKVRDLQKFPIFSNFSQLDGARAHHKGLKRINFANKNIYWHCENGLNIRIALLATSGLSFTDNGPV